ncbi:ATP-grasp domain-containing protein [Streptomyces sp. NBC_01439]|uniref:ATP-grasp domain-containing protein n=1 Tax=Streptomyces sp. NBC_01439 TaxID=2903867 RepID=UPI002E2A7C22|nr:ATP-grasp domain-containing protein [Streptomyces sp. NBC_01439]
MSALRELGARVWCVATPDIYARFGDQAEVESAVLVSDCTDVEEILCALQREGLSPSDFDAVCSQQEFSLVATALLGAELSPIKPLTAALLRDKYLQKSRIAEADIPVAGCRIHPDLAALDSVSDQLPVVVKPILGASCANTYVARDTQEFGHAIAEFRTSGFNGPFLVEEFVTGAEHHVDGIVRDGELLFLGISRYLQNVIELRSGVLSGSIALRPVLYPSLYEKVSSLARASLAALGHRDGVFHMEVFVHGDEVTFSECAGRVGGGPIDQLVSAHFGVDLHLEWAKTMFGGPGPVTAAPSGEVHGYALLMAAGTGTVRAIPSRAEFLAQDGVVSGRPMVGVGYRVDAPTAASDVHIGEVVVRGATEDDVVKRLHEINEWFRAQVVLG